MAPGKSLRRQLIMHYRSGDTKNLMLFGSRAVIEAVRAGKELDKILIQNNVSNELISELKKLIRDNNIPYQYVPPEKLNKLSNKNHQGVIAYLASVEYQEIENILPSLFEQGKTPLLLILDRITDVRNFGAIARTAECSGVNAIIIPSRGSAQINGDAIKTSAGALHDIAVCRSENLKSTIDYIKESGVQLVCCTEKSDKHYYDIDLSTPTAIIMGSEEDGISGEYLKRSDKNVKIPLLGKIESLNVSVATGIILYEAVRQRQNIHA